MLIRHRLTLTFTLLAMAIQVSLSALAWYLLTSYRAEEFNKRLEDTALVAGRLLISRRHLHDDFFQSMVRSDLLTIVDEQISIWDQQHTLVFTNRHLKDPEYYQDRITELEQGATCRFNSGRLEGIGLKYEDNRQVFFIFCAGYDTLGDAQYSGLLTGLMFINLLGLSLIIAAGWYLSGRALAPITTIVQEVETISHQHLNKRVHEGNRRDEVAQLAITFNHMLQRLETAFASQRSFVAHASHELRTPLTSIMGTLETALQYDQETQDLKTSMATAIEELKRIISLTNGLLKLAQVTDGEVALSPVQLDDCLLTAMQQIQRKYPGRQLQLHFPEADEAGFMAAGHEALLITALVNILDNACKYSTGTVSIKLEGTARHLGIWVQDQGIGISREDQQQVFIPMFRGQNTNGIPGNGIGLAVSKQVVQLMGGQLYLHSELGNGSTLLLMLKRV